MSIEKEPPLETREHAVETQESGRARNDTETPKPPAKLKSIAATHDIPKPSTVETERNRGIMKFNELDELVGKQVEIRDPHITSRPEDFAIKIATVRKEGTVFVLVIDRASWYPYYTGSRQSTFEIHDQEDLNRLQVTRLN